jgi:uncharacterized membrane protein YdjX (TVP38/TMEM64 family)
MNLRDAAPEDLEDDVEISIASIESSHDEGQRRDIPDDSPTGVAENSDVLSGENPDPAEQVPAAPPQFCASRWRKYLVPALIGSALVGVIIYVIVDSITAGNVRRALESYLGWIQLNPGPGTVSFALVYAVATVLFVPGSILTLGAGFVFAATFGLGVGIFVGAVVVFVGASLGAVGSFLLARFLMRRQVEKLSRKYAIFEAIDTAIKENGFKIFVLLRLSPLIPYNVFNYIGGVSAVSFRSYCLALVGILPGTILYVFLGASAGSLTESAMTGSDPTITIIILVLGLVPSVAAVWLTARYAKRELNRTLEARRSREEDSDPGADVESAMSGQDQRHSLEILSQQRRRSQRSNACDE